MVRAKNQTDNEFNVLFKNDVIAIGFSRVSFANNDIDNIVSLIELEYNFWNKLSQGSRTLRKNEINRFKKISNGDIIIVPYYGYVCLAIAEGKEIYDNSLIDSVDLSNQHKVKYLRSNGEVLRIPRAELSEGLQRRLRVRGRSVSDLWEFQEEINNIYMFAEDSYSWTNNIAIYEEEKKNQFKNTLLNNIRTGKTYLGAGGIGLEDIIVEMLQLEGYNAKKLPKNIFPTGADADIKATRSDIFSDTNLLIQVKHHQGFSSGAGIKQLLNIRPQDESNEYKEFKFVLITTANIDTSISEQCEEYDIDFLDGSQFIDWLFDLLPKLSEESQKKLCVTQVKDIYQIK